MNNNISRFPAFPRAVRSAPDPLGLYIRAGRNDHREVLNLLAAGDSSFFGAVFDPVSVTRHAELKDQVLGHRLDAVLDLKTQQLATPYGFTAALGTLPWGIGRPHMTSDFEGTSGRRLIGTIADFVVEHGFTQVLGPTHLLRAGDDPWLAIDAHSIRLLRNQLDRRPGGAAVPIIYSLALPYAAFRNREQRKVIFSSLKGLPLGAIWLKVDGFGAASSPTAARTYVEAASELHELGVPVIADQVGGVVGLSLLAFGAVGGLSHGVTLGERFNSSPWRRPQKGTPFATHRRVYIPALDLMLDPKQAEALMNSSTRAKSLFGCGDIKCCPRGIKDMLENPGRHFLYQRMKEIGFLSQLPESLRPQRFLDVHLRSATDKALAAATLNWEEDKLAKKMQDNRKRLDSLRVALGHLAEKNPPKTHSLLPKTRMSREARN